MSYDEIQQDLQRTYDNFFGDVMHQSEEALRTHEQNVQMHQQQMQQDIQTHQQAVTNVNDICRNIFGF